MRHFLFCLFVAALGVGTANAHDGPLDLRFGDGGMRNYGFQSYNGSGRNDRAQAVCHGPNGTLLVIGEASDARRIVTMRLLPNGDYDNSYGAGGRATLEFPMTQEANMAALCQADGKILLARPIRIDASNEMNIQLLRIQASNGQLDTSFGDNGSTLLNLDSWQSGLTRREAPYTLVALDQGEVLLLGIAATVNGNRGFAARIRADGDVPLVRVYVDVSGRPTAEALMTATIARDGTIWGIAEGKYPRTDRVTPFRVRLHRETLDWIDTPDPAPADEGGNIFAGIGIRVQPDVLAVPLLMGVVGTNPVRYVPALGVFRAGGKVILTLPAPELAGEAMSLRTSFGEQLLTPLPGNRVFYAATLGRTTDFGGYGVHTGLVEIGSGVGLDRVDTTFGNGGAQTAAFRPAGGSCTNTLVAQWLSGLTTWAGLPVFVGMVDMSCTDPAVANDYLVGRVLVDRIFGSGF